MIIRFSLPYYTEFGQRLVVCGSEPSLGQWSLDHALPLNFDASTGQWSQEISVPSDHPGPVEYKYILLDERDGGQHWEWGPNRVVPPTGGHFTRLMLEDYWRAPAEPDNELHTAAFTKALLRRPAQAAPDTSATPSTRTILAADTEPAGAIRFQLVAPRVATHHQLCVMGSDPALGAWDASKAVVLSDEAYPTWAAVVTLQQPDQPTQYKYAIRDPQTGQIVHLEAGDDRVILPPTPANTLRVRADEGFRYPAGNWRGAGVALPVFSMRTEKGLGVGEFSDLKLLADWAGRDRPEAGADSAHQRHHRYAHLGRFVPVRGYFGVCPAPAVSAPRRHCGAQGQERRRKELARLREELNASDFVDYEPVMKAKWKFIKLLYQQEKAAFLADPEFQRVLRGAKPSGWCRTRPSRPCATGSAQPTSSSGPPSSSTPQHLDQLPLETDQPISTSSACTSSPSFTSTSSCARPWTTPASAAWCSKATCPLASTATPWMPGPSPSSTTWTARPAPHPMISP